MMEYEMSEEDLKRILDAGKPVPYMSIGGVPPRRAWESLTVVWQELGQKLGFDPWTAQPIPGKGDRVFTAEPTSEEDV